MKRRIIYILSSALIVLWIYAAGSKLMDFGVFMAQLMRQPLPEWSLSLLQFGIPAIELLAALLLCFQRTLRSGFVLSAMLMILFTLYIGFGLANAFGRIPCSCGGILGSISWKGHLIFNMVFIIIASLGWYLLKKKNESENANINVIG